MAKNIQHRCVLPCTNRFTHILNSFVMFQTLFDEEHLEGLPRHRAKAAPPLPTRHLRQSPWIAYHCNESRLCTRFHFLRRHHHLHRWPYSPQKQICCAFCYFLSPPGSTDKRRGTSSSCQMPPSLHMSPKTRKESGSVSNDFRCKIRREV